MQFKGRPYDLSSFFFTYNHIFEKIFIRQINSKLSKT